MLTFNSFNLAILISNFFWPLVRILAFFSTAPIFNDQNVNKKVKIILSFLIAFLIKPFLPKVNVELFSIIGLFLLFQQILIGIALGLTCQFLFAAFTLSGEIIALQIGLSFANFFNSNRYIGTSLISRWLNILNLLFFLTLNVHLYLVFMLIDSFYKIPVDVNFLSANIFFIFLKFSSNIFLNGVMFALPIMIFFLISTLIMSILNRLSPQISIFSIGFPLNLLIGILILYYLMSMSFPFFKSLVNQLISFIFYTFLKI
ncbi:flagellar biosynthetic protein FliR [Buchnera aphidicola]|jgi:flagellar biosynthetic protein FliR|uniref:Flagellar biosynthetic protein FliR n=1 Tax=Buchnera aphidicola subsp. Schizaphis graminum (strain Sg) TaxID=198804 RepID=FLIR_BUCAP|nr:flagellar biosynthetic protein FliR [Buchnera aphidicola]Q8KA35.1 RecName: Full=Flagellar biosynthetic protein FliR [Buchnera aphidicola str. Sg (Schizaphis graminum)]AAM67647.1 flagellar biosynthetic protein FliR [Buchnera aphidicola str. Sg (Schizaphis graminum)]AWI49856.1 flagellar biosynthetic protein FliR [Buchnera aphidicola (Schizaphis graminum)]